MRHNKKKGMKLGTDASHTKAIKRGLVRALFENDRIKTIDVRAKAIRADVDHVITWAKKGDISSARSLRRPPRACGPTATAATPAS